MALVIFDLEGTLVDPLPGLRLALGRALEDEGIPIPAPSNLVLHLDSGLRSLLGSCLESTPPARLEAIYARFWEALADEGVFHQRIHPGIPLLLSRLAHQGHRLWIVTTCAAPHVRQLLHHLDLLLWFEAILAPEPFDPSPSKETILESQRAHLPADADVLLVGDRGADMELAHKFGWLPLGVLWGFGTLRELQAQGAQEIFERVEDLDAFLRNRFPEPEGPGLISRAE